MEDKIKRFLHIKISSGSGDGYGYGSGSGSGSGDGSGSGSGSGDGYGHGDGDGYGSGSGSGYGSGSGDGYGSGSGYGSGPGDGDGHGYGHGYGSGVEAINNQKIYTIDDTPTIITSVHSNYAKGFILSSDLTLSPCYIAKVGNYFAHGETLKQAVQDATAKYEQNLPIEERINRFISQYPNLSKSVKASELFDWHNKLTGSCLFGRQEFCISHGIDYTNGYYTISEFIDITINAYGSDVIKQLKNAYEKKNKDTPRSN